MKLQACEDDNNVLMIFKENTFSSLFRRSEMGSTFFLKFIVIFFQQTVAIKILYNTRNNMTL